jgi:hypothetical protein
VPPSVVDPGERLLKLPDSRLCGLLQAVIATPAFIDTASNVRDEIPADTVVFVSHNRPERSVAADLEGTWVTVKVIGDALSPRFLPTAMREGRMAGIAA